MRTQRECRIAGFSPKRVRQQHFPGKHSMRGRDTVIREKKKEARTLNLP